EEVTRGAAEEVGCDIQIFKLNERRAGEYRLGPQLLDRHKEGLESIDWDLSYSIYTKRGWKV
ncbi:hypothetical protein RRG08_008215, partial [Elysia crispata]